MSRNKKAWLNAILVMVTLLVNGLGAAGVINGLSQKAISDRYLTLITPSPSTFSIWSLIYTLLIASIIAMILKKKDAYYQKAIDEIAILFWISCAFNVVWIVLFSFELVEVSSVFIFAFLIDLSLINIKLRKIHSKGRFLLPLTFGLYSGWLMIATVVNISASLVKVQWGGFGIAHEIWAVIILLVAVVLTYLVQRNNKSAVFPLPLAWAYFGIFQFLNAPEGFNDAYPLLQVISLVGMVILIGMAAIQLYVNRFDLIEGK